MQNIHTPKIKKKVWSSGLGIIFSNGTFTKGPTEKVTFEYHPTAMRQQARYIMITTKKKKSCNNPKFGLELAYVRDQREVAREGQNAVAT